jgi:hypothetical protein
MAPQHALLRHKSSPLRFSTVPGATSSLRRQVRPAGQSAPEPQFIPAQPKLNGQGTRYPGR